MWSRSRLDIGWGDLLAATIAVFTPGEAAAADVAARWDPDGAAFLTLRTAWDALLAELRLPPGEAVVTAINIPDMFELLEHHGLRPVPVEIEAETLAPAPGAVRAALSERTRLVLVAHLLGTRIDMDALHRELDDAGVDLPVIEDCAQAFVGPHERGHPRSRVALYSFGAIKTSTALGGCLARIADDELRRAVVARVGAYPRQRRRDYLEIVCRHALLDALTAPPAYAAFVRGCRLLGRSHDELINAAVLGLRGADYWAALRRQPCTPLLVLLERRLDRFDGDRLERRRRHGEDLAGRIGGAVTVLGARAASRSWWQFAVVADDPERLITRLRAAGFDATTGASRLRGPSGASAMARVVYVPAYPELPRAELDRLARLIVEA